MRHFREHSRSYYRDIPSSSVVDHNKSIVSQINKTKEILAQKEKEREQNVFPKGYLAKQKRGNSTYIYHRWQENKKAITKYLGMENSDHVVAMVQLLEQRRYFDNEISELKGRIKSLKKDIR